MQVYAALYDADGNFVIVRKRQLNAFWGGGVAGAATLVNQAGQWALPGGGMEGGSDVDNARREFIEETGCAFPHYASTLSARGTGGTYVVVAFQIVGPAEAIVGAINHNVRSAVSRDRPSSAAVRDWELEGAVTVRRAELSAYLGYREAVDPQTQARLPFARPYSQAIDWYAEIAGWLMLATR